MTGTGQEPESISQTTLSRKSLFAPKFIHYSDHPPRFHLRTASTMSSPNGKADKMEVDRPRSLDRRSKSYVVLLLFTLLYWTFPPDLATILPRHSAPVAPIVPVLANARERRTGKDATETATTTTTIAKEAAAGKEERGPRTSPTVTGSTTMTESARETGSGGGTVMVSAAAVKEIDPSIDIAIETGRGTGTGNATVSGIGTTVTTGTAEGSARMTRTMATTAIPPTRGSRESDLTKAPRNRPSQHHHRPPVSPRPLRLWLIVRAVETILVNRIAGMATDLGVLATPGMTSMTLGTVVTESVAAP